MSTLNSSSTTDERESFQCDIICLTVAGDSGNSIYYFILTSVDTGDITRYIYRMLYQRAKFCCITMLKKFCFFFFYESSSILNIMYNYTVRGKQYRDINKKSIIHTSYKFRYLYYITLHFYNLNRIHPLALSPVIYTIVGQHLGKTIWCIIVYP